MPRAKTSQHELDTPTKNCIIGYYFATGNATAAGHNENVPPQTAQHLIQCFKETGSTANKPHTG
jgi:hypothetical protein